MMKKKLNLNLNTKCKKHDKFYFIFLNVQNKSVNSFL